MRNVFPSRRFASVRRNDAGSLRFRRSSPVCCSASNRTAYSRIRCLPLRFHLSGSTCGFDDRVRQRISTISVGGFAEP
jgi:hypothetical protein